MKKIEKEINDILIDNDITINNSLVSTIIKVNFGVELNLTKEEIEVFENSLQKGKIKIVCEEPVLDDKEIEYLRAVIKPFRDKVKYIFKGRIISSHEEYIKIILKNENAMSFPGFCQETMYKGMELERHYTLDELGL